MNTSQKKKLFKSYFFSTNKKKSSTCSKNIKNEILCSAVSCFTYNRKFIIKKKLEFNHAIVQLTKNKKEMYFIFCSENVGRKIFYRPLVTQLYEVRQVVYTRSDG